VLRIHAQTLSQAMIGNHWKSLKSVTDKDSNLNGSRLVGRSCDEGGDDAFLQDRLEYEIRPGDNHFTLFEKNILFDFFTA